MNNLDVFIGKYLVIKQEKQVPNVGLFSPFSSDGLNRYG